MAQKSTTRKSTAKSNDVSDVVENVTGKIGAFAGDARDAIAEAGSTALEAAGNLFEGAKEKAGELASNLPIIGDEPKKPTRARSTTSRASSTGAKSSTTHSTGTAKSSTAKKTTTTRSKTKTS